MLSAEADGHTRSWAAIGCPRYPPERETDLDAACALSANAVLCGGVLAREARDEPPLTDDYATFRRRTGKDLYDGVPLSGS
jgi:hypothetical protein